MAVVPPLLALMHRVGYECGQEIMSDIESTSVKAPVGAVKEKGTARGPKSLREQWI